MDHPGDHDHPAGEAGPQVFPGPQHEPGGPAPFPYHIRFAAARNNPITTITQA